ncbi:protein Z, vitamin K-dependent plasma glycoprotein a [Neoarius graeffei]|uniref:protein Z, vitamin K-dependent plasma glycoprotein a n=1 Tax=Neoarius graeffei TaxID=443677 RepID=UPI00298D53E9|nr:protein Z, vitamin K-dependent plasma glycoprotein a [Neoarius graeffei]XP_060767054.1 protein Z, vitamin K-dependent plasma glycoprotein a [Neoarius graeffei]
MVWLSTALSLTLLLGYVTAGLDKSRVPVFLDQKEASEVISRQKRANAGNEENTLNPNLERECLEEVCSYEEAREVFQDIYRTDIFWSVYIDGDQCANQPCKNGAMCSDSVGGYDCICKSGFSGVHCETDQTKCVIDKNKGCSQFCKPGYQSYECSCAWGWKLEQKDKCVPAVPFPCGKVSSLSQWTSQQSKNIQSDYEGLDCNAEECPWQALLHNSKLNGFCSGVIIKENFVLTTAQCVLKYTDFSVAVGKMVPTYEIDEQDLYVKKVHVHPLYLEGKPENDLAVIELKDKIMLKKKVVPACLPERDFAENVLISGEHMGVVTGWQNASEFVGNLRLNHLSYSKLSACVERHSGQVTNKMACTLPRPKVDCFFGSGSPILTLYREVFFLTGVVSQSPGLDCSNGYVFQKVSRFLPWLRNVMGSL